MKKADIATGIGLIIFSTWVFWYASAYSKATIYYYGPNFFPQVLAIAMSICAIILILNAVKGKSMEKSDKIELRGFLRMVIAIAICIGYLFLMQVLGFAISTSIFLYVLMVFIGQQGLKKRIISAIAVALIVWAIFRYFLVIPLPTGMFAFTF